MHGSYFVQCFYSHSMQWKIINSILNEKRDNCVIMATGKMQFYKTLDEFIIHIPHLLCDIKK